MIVKEKYNDRLTRTYSDAGYYISPVENPDVLYIEAIDPTDAGREYFESDYVIPIDEEEFSE